MLGVDADNPSGALGLYEEVLAARADHPEAIARLEALLQKDPANARAAAALETAYATRTLGVTHLNGYVGLSF